MPWIKRIGKILAFVIFWIGLGGTPDDLTGWQSWLKWLDDNTYDWRLVVGGIALFAVIQFWNHLIPKPSDQKPERIGINADGGEVVSRKSTYENLDTAIRARQGKVETDESEFK